MFNGQEIRAFINTASQTVGGDLIKRELISLARLVVNAGGAFVEAMSKLKKDGDRDEYRKEARAVCRRAMKGLRDQLEKLKKEKYEQDKVDQDASGETDSDRNKHE